MRLSGSSLSLFIICSASPIITSTVSCRLAIPMQNLLVFCRYCFTWVEPHSQMCPECSAEIVLDDHDLDRDVLSEILGKPLSVLGCVRIDRPGLPNLGELIGTTEGVLFLPRLHRRLNGAWEGVESSRLPGWWPFRGDQTSPRFLEWLKHPLGIKDEQISPVDPVADGSRCVLPCPSPDTPSFPPDGLAHSPAGWLAWLACGEAGSPDSPPAVTATARTRGPNSTAATKLLPVSP